MDDNPKWGLVPCGVFLLIAAFTPIHWLSILCSFLSGTGFAFTLQEIKHGNAAKHPYS